ncbi:MAG: class I fructose-bisphosphate aldolase [Vulcanimicrobiaceae bacterium]
MSSQLAATAKAMVAAGRGILAADESTKTANKRFALLDIEQTEEKRRQYRQLLFTAPYFGDYISGVILYDETIHQSADDGRSFVQVLHDADAIPGIKLDTGGVPLALGGRGELVTEGLDGLAKRVEEYVALGARFAKWRAVIAIDEGIPTDALLLANAHSLARYAAICQAGGLVPIVEPEVLSDGEHSKHSLEKSFEVHERALRIQFEQLAALNVRFEEMVLKPSFVIPGQKSGQKATARKIADATVTVLTRWVPAAVGGIAFLSGGQSDEAATLNLNEVNTVAQERPVPWNLTFSYGRALQHQALTTWRGSAANVKPAQAEFTHRVKMNSLASLGTYTPDAEKEKSLVLA